MNFDNPLAWWCPWSTHKRWANKAHLPGSLFHDALPADRKRCHPISGVIVSLLLNLLKFPASVLARLLQAAALSWMVFPSATEPVSSHISQPIPRRSSPPDSVQPNVALPLGGLRFLDPVNKAVQSPSCAMTVTAVCAPSGIGLSSPEFTAHLYLAHIRSQARLAIL